MEDQQQTKQSRMAQVKEFIVVHKTKILIGTVIVFALANRGLRKDLGELKHENKELEEKAETAEQKLERNESYFDAIFGPRRY